MLRWWDSRRRAKKVRRLRARDGSLCIWCKCQLCFDGKNGLKSATIEHLRPISRGGTHNIKNLALACLECNRARGNSMSMNADWLHRNGEDK